ncbi:uncharacterized protein LOC132927133 [Rhopalosiphum padi]|uniref:uncharacterized protein LOC132927133 n=1 Tax=Rhopalosiphum padi TaxID=40932 RepID=UPI00298DB109|nr:uncharacterized protein LOC132927133 [Rhopalosiphum padi]
MYHYHCLLLISSILILTVRIQSQDSKGPGISSCCFFGGRTDCGLSNVLITDIPGKCTSVIYSAVYMDLEYFATDSYYKSDFTILDYMLNSSKPVFINYLHENQQEWATALSNSSSNEGNKTFDEMKAIKGFFEEHPKIAGVILTGLQYTGNSSNEIPGLSENLKKFLELLKQAYPELAVGLELHGRVLIDQYTTPKFDWLNINDFDSVMDFYVVSLEFFNTCYSDLRDTGTVPMNGIANYTLDKLKNVLEGACFPNEKIYFKFKTNPVSTNDNLTICKVNNEEMCLCSQEASLWCADTQLSYNEKGQFSKDYGAGFMVRYIDYDDPESHCQCATPYPAFNALLDGFNNVGTQNCPGISSCCFYGELSNADCGLSEVLITKIPKDCTSVIYTALFVDLNYYITDPLVINNDFKVLDSMLESGKRVFTYYGHDNQAQWSEVLACESSNGGANSLDEMKSLKAFFDKHPKIEGVILTNLLYDLTSSEFPGYTENLKTYLEVMRKKFPKLVIGFNLIGVLLIDQFINPKFKWLDITVIDSVVDFYDVSLEFFNPCTADLRNTGITPMNGSNTKYTLEKVRDALQQLSFPKEKTYFKFRTSPVSPDDSKTICDVNIAKMCVDPSIACDWCADTLLSYNEKGQYSKENGEGFMVRYIDIDDPENCCNCEKPYPAFHAILDGFKGVSTKPCDLLNRS